MLRFYGYWDDRNSEFGEIHVLEIHYYLADDTIEIKEMIPENSGKDSGFMFLRRQRLPKLCQNLPKPGADAPFTILNVLGKGRFVADPLDCGKEDIDIYKEEDLAIGCVVNCYGRKIVLTDCDPFTKEYYRIKYGLEKITSLEIPKEEVEVVSVKVKDRELPPWNGFGTFEDSAQNCVTVELKPLLKDVRNFIKYDRYVKTWAVIKVPKSIEKKFI